MKNDTDLTPPVRVDETTGTLSTKVPPRVFILNAIQIIGVLTAALNLPSAETAAVLAMLPDAIAGNIGKITLLLLAAKPGVNLLADYVDNGKVDGSWKDGQGVIKAIIFALLPAFVFGLTSCGTGFNIAPPDAAGCFMLTQTKDGKTYSFGPCADAEGKVYAYRGSWTNAEGVKLRSTYILASKTTSIQYSPDGGLTWIGYSSKSGISLDGMPPVVNDPAT